MVGMHSRSEQDQARRLRAPVYTLWKLTQCLEADFGYLLAGLTCARSPQHGTWG
jgi:hypothetical protein